MILEPATAFFVVQMLVCYANGACLGTVQQVNDAEECRAMITAAKSKAVSVVGECNEYPTTAYTRFFPKALDPEAEYPPLLNIPVP
jgi:hypothetical protein